MLQVLSFPRKALAAATADAVSAAFVVNCISAAFHLFVPLTQNRLLHLFVSHLLLRRGLKRADLSFEALGSRVQKKAVYLANLVIFHRTEQQNKNTG